MDNYSGSLKRINFHTKKRHNLMAILWEGELWHSDQQWRGDKKIVRWQQEEEGGGCVVRHVSVGEALRVSDLSHQ